MAMSSNIPANLCGMAYAADLTHADVSSLGKAMAIQQKAKLSLLAAMKIVDAYVKVGWKFEYDEVVRHGRHVFTSYVTSPYQEKYIVGLGGDFYSIDAMYRYTARRLIQVDKKI
ncbi:hypothetical protein MUDAN_BIHEEGNE_03408 [Lactiplantibacillus mudanjiangensis]|nr:hypothetical protein MUDAN_BIHEEGNE_03408 [Lactiplantibacillus mudanjiangensis]